MIALRVVVASLLFTLGTSVFPNVSAPPAGVVASFEIPKTTFLSTEEPSGTLVLKNGFTRALTFNLLSVYLMIRRSDGTFEKRQWIQGMLHIQAGTPIAPGAIYEVRIPLPKCNVNSDPCSLQLTITCRLENPGETYELTSNTVSYRFLPDSEATFAVDALGRDRPLLMAQGDGSGTLTPNARAISFIISGPTTVLEGISERILDIFNATMSTRNSWAI